MKMTAVVATESNSFREPEELGSWRDIERDVEILLESVGSSECDVSEAEVNQNHILTTSDTPFMYTEMYNVEKSKDENCESYSAVEEQNSGQVKSLNGVIFKLVPDKGDNENSDFDVSVGSKTDFQLERGTSCYDNPPDGGWGWMVTFGAFMISVILDGIAFSFGMFFVELLNHFKASQSETSCIISVLNGSYLGIGPVASALVTAFGTRKIGMIGAFLAAVGFFLCTWSPSVHVMIVLYGLVGGAGLGLVYLPAIVTVGHYFDKKRALATGIAVCGSGVGSFIFAPLCEFLIETYTWKGAMWIISALVLNCIPMAALLRPLEENNRTFSKGDKWCKQDNKKLLDEKSGEGKASAKSRDIAKMFDFALLKSPTFLLYAFSCFLATVGFFIPFTFIPGQIQVFGMTLRQSALLISIIGIFNTVTRIVVGWTSDRSWADASIINVVALILGGVATMCVPILSNFSLFTIFCGFFGASLAVFVSLRSIITAELLGVERLTSSFGLVTMCQGVAAAIGSPIAGALSDMTGDYKGAFILAGVTIALAGVICIPLRRIRAWETGQGQQDQNENIVMTL